MHNNLVITNHLDEALNIFKTGIRFALFKLSKIGEFCLSWFIILLCINQIDSVISLLNF